MFSVFLYVMEAIRSLLLIKTHILSGSVTFKQKHGFSIDTFGLLSQAMSLCVSIPSLNALSYAKLKSGESAPNSFQAGCGDVKWASPLFKDYFSVNIQ